MFYLLWEPSLEECNDESFVLFQTDAEEETAKKFIDFYFEGYEILSVFPSYMELNKEVDQVSFTNEEIEMHYKQIKLKNEAEENYDKGLYEFLKSYPSYFDFEERLKETEIEMLQTIYRYFTPGTVTPEIIEQLKKEGFEKAKNKNGNIRFRRVDYKKIQEEYDEKMKKLRLEREEASKLRSLRHDEYESVNPRPVFNLKERYSKPEN